MQLRQLVIPVVIILLSSCGRQPKIPKPFGYFRISLPNKEYAVYKSPCPYEFEYPTYASITKDTDANTEPCWFNIDFPDMKATIHCSFKTGGTELQQYMNDSRALVYKHTIKAEAINETVVSDSIRQLYGILYDIKGNAASSIQFYLTDSTDKFMRGSLYFNVPPNKDSLAPVLEFIREDILHLIDTYVWK